MPRIQILDLPEGVDDDRPPFALVIDQYVPQRIILDPDQTSEPSDPLFNQLRQVGEQIGARGVLIFEDTIEIPANEVSIGPDGYPVRVRVEGDFEKFREQVQDEITKAQRSMTSAIREQAPPNPSGQAPADGSP
ncbi:hypothetical protein JJV70_01950 [Streptomyces sp. JJ66]|uniref:hypothetical protein n=1 Tax=Streptomyces sp. JJ66 TaxID=2803843 RepID=UPI001C577418|nr:hypothetical protein [Streptomyces sp. JJ66]MBW1600883.1 hypothetical protein [Streptomyces sp. JJ66]